MLMCSAFLWERHMSLILQVRKMIFRLNKCPRIIELVSSTPKIPLKSSWPQNPCTCYYSILPPTVQAFSLSSGHYNQPHLKVPVPYSHLISLAFHLTGLGNTYIWWYHINSFPSAYSDFILKVLRGQRSYSLPWVSLLHPIPVQKKIIRVNIHSFSGNTDYSFFPLLLVFLLV